MMTGIGVDNEQLGVRPENLYGEEYFRTSCGLPYTRSEPHWQTFFSRIADQIILSLRPKRVLDAGCAMGFLVEAFWDRGIEAWGIDVSEFAISQVRRDIAPYCLQASLTEPISGKFDLVVSIEVLEHLSDSEARIALENLTAATDTILFSSTPTDLDEPTHINVRPTISWLRLFSECGFAPDALYDARFVAPHAILFRRSPAPVSDDANILFSRLVQQRIETHARDMRIGQLQQQANAAAARQREMEGERDRLQQQADQAGAHQIRVESELADLRQSLRTIAEQVRSMPDQHNATGASLARIGSGSRLENRRRQTGIAGS